VSVVDGKIEDLIKEYRKRAAGHYRDFQQVEGSEKQISVGLFICYALVIMELEELSESNVK